MGRLKIAPAEQGRLETEVDLTHDFIVTNDITLHVVKAGPEDGPLLILLHGFPEYWYSWRHQIPALVEAGYHVWIPDQRGYNLSEKPPDIAEYGLDKLSGDVIGLIEAAGEDSARIVGHDWGGAVAWWTANKYPQHVTRLGILNAPHHKVMGRFLRTNSIQRRRSWYMFAFQVPRIPEVVFSLLNWRVGTRVLTGSSREGTFAASDLERYRRAWAQPRAMRSMVNWYRAMMKTRPERLESLRITVPALLIWGVRDRALGREMAQPSIELCDDGRLEFIEEASHWVQHEAPHRINELLLGFLA